MKIYQLALISLMSLGVSDALAFGLSPLSKTLLDIPSPSELFKEHANRMEGLRQHYPRYEISQDDSKFQVAVDVPGVDASDIDVKLEAGGKVLTLSGGRKSQDEHHVFTSKFQQSFSLDPNIDTSKISANLHNGVLFVDAPKLTKELPETVTKIPVTQHEQTEKVEIDSTVAS